VPLSVTAAFIVLALTASSASAYIVVSGGRGLMLPGDPASAPAAAAAETPGATPGSTRERTPPLTGDPTPEPERSPIATATPATAPSPSPSPVPEATASPAPTAEPTSTARPRPTPTTVASRFAGLDRCPAPASCYIYVVRPGDNLFSIANFFGSTLREVQAMNPALGSGASLHAGDEVRLPPP
jgi:hypothetical protein